MNGVFKKRKLYIVLLEIENKSGGKKGQYILIFFQPNIVQPLQASAAWTGLPLSSSISFC